MSKPHKHAELIKAWADGAEIEWYDSRPTEHRWKKCNALGPSWDTDVAYRVKPQPKPDIVMIRRVDMDRQPDHNFPNGLVTMGAWANPNVEFTFDGETFQLKKAELI